VGEVGSSFLAVDVAHEVALVDRRDRRALDPCWVWQGGAVPAAGSPETPSEAVEPLRETPGMTTFAEKPTLRSERLVLRPIVATDADAMWADLDDAEGMRLTGTHTEFSRDAIDRWAASRSDADDRLDLAVTDSKTGEWLGEVVINEWDPDNRSCSFRIALSAHARNRGVGTEATRLLLDHVFDEIDDPPVHRVELAVFAFNPRAIAVYERVGFIREGVSRDALLWDGEFVDSIQMAMLRTDRTAH
jgi:RimJ/RimL family protein N-acetyltransferase